MSEEEPKQCEEVSEDPQPNPVNANCGEEVPEDPSSSAPVHDACCEEEEVPVDPAVVSDATPLVVETEQGRKARIAVAGCSHGEMEKIYEVMQLIEQEKGYKFDLLICCGDYQAIRNYGDLHHMKAPQHHKKLQTFYKYYSGEKVAPVLTLFIGGNHESCGYMAELPNGGWVAPKIFYMGYANVVNFAGLRIAGLSGIFDGRKFDMNHYERPPYVEMGDLYGAYYVRNVDMFRLKQLRPANDDKTSNPIDIMLTHDWPSGIANFGDAERLFSIKKDFRRDHEAGKLGNPQSMKLLYDVRPRYWLSAHLHIAFAALVPHKGSGDARPQPTRFLSLDKPILRRQFLQALELNIKDDAKMELSYDTQWLAILKNTDHLTSCEKTNVFLPGPNNDGTRHDFRPTKEEIDEILELGEFPIDEMNFKQTAPPLIEVTEESKNAASSLYYRNPQSADFCSWLNIKDLNKMMCDNNSEDIGTPYYMTSVESLNQDDVDFGDESFVIDRGDAEPEAKRPRMSEEGEKEGEDETLQEIKAEQKEEDGTI